MNNIAKTKKKRIFFFFLLAFAFFLVGCEETVVNVPGGADTLISLGCANNEIAKYNSSSGLWECSDDNIGNESSGDITAKNIYNVSTIYLDKICWNHPCTIYEYRNTTTGQIITVT